MTLLDVSKQGRVLEVSQGHRVNQNCLQPDVSPNFCKNNILFVYTVCQVFILGISV